MSDQQTKRFERIVTAICIVLIIAVPLLAVSKIPVYHTADVSKFGEWSLDYSRDPGSVYQKGPYCNYPFLGVFFSAGLLSFLYTNFEYTTIPAIHQDFRLLLALFDGLGGIIVGLVLVLLGIRHAFAYALLLTLLPSNWIVTVFGQIDNVTQAFIMGGFAALLGSIFLIERGRRRMALVSYALAAGLVLNGLLVKQLFAISLPALGLAWLYTTDHLRRKGVLVSHLIALHLPALLLFFYPDFIVELPDGARSHLLWIFTGEASNHGARISSGGFNLWLFLGESAAGLSSDRAWRLGISARHWGYAGLAAVLSFVLVFLLRRLKTYIQHQTGSADAYLSLATARSIFALLLIMNGIINLSFNVFMTGTHGRHLHHSFPFLLIGLCFFLYGDRQNRRRTYRLSSALLLVILTALLYGAFLYSLIAGPSAVWMLQPAARAASLALLLVYLLWIWSRRTLLTIDRSANDC